MDVAAFPSLYESAEKLARSARNRFQFLIAAEYAVLLVAGAVSLAASGSGIYFAIVAFIFVVSLAIMIFRTLSTPEQEWYKARALAEAVKGAAWRFMMQASPYDKEEDRAEANFRKTLKRLVNDHESIVGRMTVDEDADEITKEMRDVRAMDLDARKRFYLDNRIEDQRRWYRAKANSSQAAYRRWIMICTAVYVAAVASVIVRAAWPDWTYSPAEVFIILASALLGWVQMKKYNELASSYALAAQEAGFMDGALDEADSEETLSAFVGKTEVVFSREQTGWATQGYA